MLDFFKERRRAVPVEEEVSSVLGDLARKLQCVGGVEYERQPVPVAQWINDPYYVGPRAHNLWPAVKDTIVQACNPQYTEILLSGAIAWGKTSAGCMILLRLLYELSCMVDPAVGVGLGEGSALYMIFISTSKEKAKETGFGRFRQFVYSTPYFQENFLPDDRVTGSLRFPKNIYVKPAVTNEHGILSYDLVGLVIDEAAFMRVTERSKLTRGTEETYDQAREIYTQAKVRMKTRLHSLARGMKAKLIIASSALYPDDFLNRRKMESSQNREADVFLSEMALWEAKPVGTYSPEVFAVEVGDEMRFSRILRKGDTARADARIVHFPMDFKDDAERDLERALRDIAGVPLLTLAPLITDRQKVFAGIRRPAHDGTTCSCPECFAARHPYSIEETCLTDGHTLLKDVLAYRVEDPKDPDCGLWRPRADPRAPRFVHLDLSFGKEDAMGFSMVHPLGYATRPTRNALGEEKTDLAVRVSVDLMLRIVRPPEPGSEIPWQRVESLLEELTVLGFPIALVTMDSPAGRYLMQRLIDRGYLAEHLSVDKTVEPYVSLRTALYEGLVSYYEYEPFLQELLLLEYNRSRKKIDHPRRGAGKDVADAVCGAVFTAMTRYAEFDSSPSAISVQIL